MRNSIFLFLSLTPFFLFSQTKLEVFKQGDFYGFKKGKAIYIEPQFEYATDFFEGLALCQKKGKFGFIDTLGKTIIPFQYEKAGRMESGRAFISLNGKMGVIDHTGKMIIQPTYSSVEKAIGGYWLFNGKMKGFSSTHGAIIPPIYADIKSIGTFKNALKSKGIYDVYNNDSLIIENSDQAIEQRNITLLGDLVIRKDGKSGVFNPKKGWVIAPEFDEINFVEVDNYVLNGKNINQLIVAKRLSHLAYDYPELFEFETELPYLYRIYKLNGEQLADLEFDAIENFNDDLFLEDIHSHFIAHHGDSLYILNDKIAFDIYPYQSIESHLNWWIAKDQNNFHILDKHFKKIGTFLTVSPDFRWVNLDEQYYFDADLVQEKIMEDYLIVSSIIDSVEQKAVFYLPEGKIISPWFAAPFEVSNIRNDNYFPVMFIFKQNNLQGYYVEGMKAGSEVKYNQIITLNEYLILQLENQKDELYRYFLGEVNFIHAEEQIFKSSSLYYLQELYDEYGEPLGEASLITYSSEFVCTKGLNSKFGLYTFDGTIFPPVYDTLIQDISLLHVINTIQGDKKGVIDVNYGTCIPPRWSEIPPLDYFTDTYEIYATFLDKDENPYFIDGKGRTLYSINLDHKVYKKGRKYGLTSYKDFDPEGDRFVSISARYKSLKSINPYFGYYEAKGKRGTTGVISSLGDTIVPFGKYQIRLSDFQLDPGGLTFEIIAKNKKGLYSTKLKEILPVAYQRIDYLKMNEENFYLYLVAQKEGKYGLFTNTGEEILPCVYDSLLASPIYAGDSYFSLYLIAKKDTKTSLTLIDNPFVNIRSKIAESVKYDEMYGSVGIVKNGEMYHFYDVTSNEKKYESKTKDFTIPGSLFNIVVKAGKYGAEDTYGNSLISCEYDHAEFLSNRPEIMFATKGGINYYIYVFDNLIYTEDQW
jgi:hypothetical protein